MSELKPCPFCGGEAEIYRHALVSWVRCKECGVDTPAALPQDEQLDIDFWNTRAERTCENVDDHKTVWFICSVCGYTQKLSHTRSYCSNCGAKVVGE